jgi:hypothetical protein
MLVATIVNPIERATPAVASRLTKPTHTSDKFFADRDLRGRPAEYLTVAYFQARGIPAHLNEATEEDRAGRASHDIVVGNELWEVKTDLLAGQTRRLFVERASLEHTGSERFCYFIPSPYGFDMRIFPTMTLVEMFNERNPILNLNEGINGLFKYKRAFAGDQPDNEGMFVPMEVVKQVGLQPWEVAKQLTQRG